MGYPRELKTVLDQTARDLREQGHAADEAETLALRQAQHAGWYETIDGWKQIAPDLREKINVRKAVKQPDGRYLIQDVDVFYPNAVKGGGGEVQAYDSDDCLAIIRNTQLGVEAGNPVPLTRTHVRPEHKFTGVVIPSVGELFNWRESPRGAAWARCDILADADCVNDWRRNRITGLSAGINRDAAGLNTRIGHVAALGGEPQALSRLPRTQIYAAEEIVSCGDQVCFSADDGAIGAPMLDHAKLKPQMDALHAAFAAVEAGEPGGLDKLKEAHGNYCSASKEMFEAEAPPAIEAKSELNKEIPAGEPSQEQLAGVGYAALDGVNFAADPEGAFKALMGVVKSGGAAHARTTEQVAALTLENAKLKREKSRDEFSTYIGGLRTAGHNFAAEDAMSAYDACNGNVAAITGLKALLGKSAKVEPLANKDDVFSATDGNQPAPTKPGKNGKLAKAENGLTAKQTADSKKLRDNVDSSNFTADDFDAAIAIGDAATALQLGAGK